MRVAAGEMVGAIAAQSIGEPCTNDAQHFSLQESPIKRFVGHTETERNFR